MWTREQLETLLDERVLVFDGAMGTELYEHGFGFERAFDGLNLTHPHVVRRVHRDYVNAGAHVLTTNSFGANALRLARSHFADQVGAINEAAVKLAREESEARPPHNRPYVAASVGPLGQPLAPIGRLTREAAADAYRVLRKVQHTARLDEQPTQVDATSLRDERRAIEHLWAAVFVTA